MTTIAWGVIDLGLIGSVQPRGNDGGLYSISYDLRFWRVMVLVPCRMATWLNLHRPMTSSMTWVAGPRCRLYSV